MPERLAMAAERSMMRKRLLARRLAVAAGVMMSAVVRRAPIIWTAETTERATSTSRT